MRTATLALLLLLLLAGGTRADEAAVRFEQANQQYRNAAFAEAAKSYEAILASGQESASLYYNLGNAYFKLQDMPSAILNYERALRLSPGDEDIRYNLRLANLRVIDKIEPVPVLFFVEWWEGLVASFSADTWAVATVACLWAAAVAGALMFALRSYLAQRLMLAGVLCALALGAVAFTAGLQRRHVEGTAHAAIVVAASVPVKSAPDKASVDLFVLHEGVKVELLDEVGIWHKIRLADGKVGWLPVEAFIVI